MTPKYSVRYKKDTWPNRGGEHQMWHLGNGRPDPHSMPSQAFSFAVAGLLGMVPETSQALLEMTNAQQRLNTVLEMINTIGSTLS